jgi:hypothetical protein
MRTAKNYHFEERHNSIFKLAWEMTVIFFYFGLILAAYVYLSEMDHTPESGQDKPPVSDWSTDL